jgi:rhodanese-related sulfurtransferase
VPGGLSVVIRKNLPSDTKERIQNWFIKKSTKVGFTSIAKYSDVSSYKEVSQLGTFTPKQLPGSQVVNAEQVKQMVLEGVTLVDVRIEKEYKQKHIPHAIHAPYAEKSIKDIAFQADQDDFSALEKLGLDKTTKVIFSCNGPECWKSYKASQFAIRQGYEAVYWFRGGLPEWEASGEPIEQIPVMVAPQSMTPASEASGASR